MVPIETALALVSVVAVFVAVAIWFVLQSALVRAHNEVRHAHMQLYRMAALAKAGTLREVASFEAAELPASSPRSFPNDEQLAGEEVKERYEEFAKSIGLAEAGDVAPGHLGGEPLLGEPDWKVVGYPPAAERDQ